MSHQVAKLFWNGRSQAVRLPAQFRFEGEEVFIHRDPHTGDIILSRKPGSWEDYFEMLKSLKLPADLFTDRKDTPPQKRNLF
ncbi:MAG: addiction module, SpoVT/AbrB protein [uncultured bacterium]|nr:MAG: addiction module, SpoVT/AbrB protein [uncultured bacterium]OGT23635.1 MAG: AbrB family transcriptional regulator [Gammaproteobacteria bacterium RIFCSPHIGHO2_12_38_15]OGT66902.1 MAG: AbrB family transcriptional regulator [Gammaproteobacteria bacterium RIFCSPLOWO2_02_FULL_38_11]OGT77245.1 MAG: AbrB family transcriptional regulator [Gammaproteobacteria bacterium RIFCSPLOWO2_12_FULL_38_14]